MFDKDLHKSLLLRTLKEIYTDNALSSLLGFKGGTAAYFFHKLERFSVDLDFDLLNPEKEDLVFEKLKEILEKFGTIKELHRKRNTVFFLLSYLHESKNIKVEISKRNFGSKYELKSYLGIEMLVMIPSDMFAHKLVAMLERGKTANRDIFDTYFFFKNNWSINEIIIQTRTGLPLISYLEKVLDFLELQRNKDQLIGIGELLDEKQKIWVKTKLIDELIFLIRLRIEIYKKRST